MLIRIFKRVVAKPISLAIIIVVPLFIVCWHAAVVHRAAHPEPVAARESSPSVAPKSSANLQQIAKEVGSIRKFIGTPVPNHAGTKILFKQTTDTGVGMFFSEVPNGHRQLVYEQPEKDYHAHDVMFLGWSSD